MNFAEAFRYMEDNVPDEPTPAPEPQTPSTIHSQYTGFASRPVLYNMDGWISPFPSNNWDFGAPIYATLDDESRFPGLDNRLDPNKIFSSDLTALKTLAADQLKVTKLFEKRLMESLRERGKVGLTEEDVIAMQAVTAARSAVTSIQKEQSAIKKNIAEIRLKQQQQQANSQKYNGAPGAPDTVTNPMSNVGIGRSILDDIFSASGSSIDMDTGSTIPTMQETDIAQANQVLDELVPTVGIPIQYEHLNPTTYVLLGETDDDVEYATYAANGELLPEYPSPTTQIAKIDREALIAQDTLMENYPIKLKSEM
jgi:hypothetical protein